MRCGRFRPSRWAVHPHGRGDNNAANASDRYANGSPPRAWGQYDRHPQRCDIHRFTPTGVGTITLHVWVMTAGSVHPHGRGDNDELRQIEPRAGGSPPRAWGQLTARKRYYRLGRFTPTGVGTISCCPTQGPKSSVHPHGRGDNTLGGYTSYRRVGSPPRAWGQYQALPAGGSITRFTPTGVGTMHLETRP